MSLLRFCHAQSKSSQVKVCSSHGGNKEPYAEAVGQTPPEPEPPLKRAGESTRIPLKSPEKLALHRPARGGSLASSLAGSFRGTGGGMGTTPAHQPPSHRAGCADVAPRQTKHLRVSFGDMIFGGRGGLFLFFLFYFFLKIKVGYSSSSLLSSFFFFLKKKNYSTRTSHVVPHRTTIRAGTCLTSQIRRDAVLSRSYGRRCM